MSKVHLPLLTYLEPESGYKFKKREVIFGEDVFACPEIFGWHFSHLQTMGFTSYSAATSVCFGFLFWDLSCFIFHIHACRQSDSQNLLFHFTKKQTLRLNK